MRGVVSIEFVQAKQHSSLACRSNSSSHLAVAFVTEREGGKALKGPSDSNMSLPVWRLMESDDEAAPCLAPSAASHTASADTVSTSGRVGPATRPRTQLEPLTSVKKQRRMMSTQKQPLLASKVGGSLQESV